MDISVKTSTCIFLKALRILWQSVPPICMITLSDGGTLCCSVRTPRKIGQKCPMP